MISLFIFKLIFLFAIGSFGGWVVELLFRRFFSAKKWINPGFLVGPCLPLYGFGVVGMYLLCLLGEYINIENQVLKSILIILMMVLTMTLIEYIAGIIFVKRLHIKLWDYSDRWLNIQGLICPLFSLIWLAVSAIYYLFVNKYVVILADLVVQYDFLLFYIGIFVGVLFVDLCYSFEVSKRISKIAKESKIIIKYEQLKQSIKEELLELKEKTHFVLAFKSSVSLVDSVKRYISNKKNPGKKAQNEESNSSEEKS